MTLQVQSTLSKHELRAVALVCDAACVRAPMVSLAACVDSWQQAD